MKLIISPRAARRLREIQAHIALDANLHTALRVVLRIRQSAEMLTDFPKIAPEDGPTRALLRVVLRIRQSAEMLTDFPKIALEDGPTRALVVSGLPYRIHYRLLPDAVEIITIAHTSLKPPRFV